MMNGSLLDARAAVRIALLCGMGVLALLLAARPAHAATFTVDRADDSSASNCTASANDCGLRGAINAANTLAGADTIGFASGVSTVTLATTGTGENDNVAGDLDIRDDVTIQGGTGVTIQGGTNWTERVVDVIGAPTSGNRTDVTITDATIRGGNATVGTFRSTYGGGIRLNGETSVSGATSLSLQRSTVTDNDAEQSGGGIYDEGGSTIVLEDSTVSANTAGRGINGFGGGIASSGSLTLTRSTISGNTGTDLGGGLSLTGPATLSMTDSTVSGNTAVSSGGYTNGGGIYASNSGAIKLTSSTVSGNTAGASGPGGGQGGGIYADGTTVTLENTTVSGNTANNGTQLDADGDGGGIYTGNATIVLAGATVAGNTAGAPGTGGSGGGVYGVTAPAVTVRNTIVAANSADIAPNFGATLTSQGYNLFGENPGNLAGTDTVNANPLLGPLADNGGPTQTHALQTGSPAIDAANPATPGGAIPACEASDQRGEPRPRDGDGNGTARCDIGAFEKGAGGGSSPSLTINDRSIKEGNSGTKSMVFTVTLSAASAQSVTAGYATADGRAKAPSDYAAQGGTLNFAPGDTTKTITVPIVGDRRRERNESFFVNLSNATNATIGDAQGRGTIRNND